MFQYGNMQQHESNVILASKRSDMRYLKAESHESVEKKISVRFRIACDHIETHSNCGVLSIPASKQDITKHFKPRSLRSGAQKRDGRVCFNMVKEITRFTLLRYIKWVDSYHNCQAHRICLSSPANMGDLENH